MRKNIMRILEYLHVLLLVSMFTPLIYVISRWMEIEEIYKMYFASFLLIIPIIGFMKVEKKCKNFVQYLLMFFGISFFIISPNMHSLVL